MDKNNILWWFLVVFVVICAFALGVKVGEIRSDLRGGYMMNRQGGYGQGRNGNGGYNMMQPYDDTTPSDNGETSTVTSTPNGI
jgi:hypothetical protein